MRGGGGGRVSDPFFVYYFLFRVRLVIMLKYYGADISDIVQG